MSPPKAKSPTVMDQLPALRRYALSLTRHPGDAEDLVHDALIKAMEHRPGPRTDGNIRGWMMSILHNLHVDRRRSAASLSNRDRELAARSVEGIPPSQLDTVRLAQVRRAFNQLPDEQREALHLVTIEGLTYEEAAAVLGLPAGTVMSRIARGREALRRWENAPDLRLVSGGET